MNWDPRVSKKIFNLFDRMWFKGSVKRYVLDWVNLGLDYDEQNFQFRFNPRHPVAVLKFRKHLWVICLPGKRREKQGQILYHKRFSRDGPDFEACQWSPTTSLMLAALPTAAGIR